MSKLKNLILCGSILGNVLMAQEGMAASTASSLNSRMNLELDDKGSLTIKNTDKTP